MSLSDPRAVNPSNPGVAKGTSFGDAKVPDTRTASPINQIRGIAGKGSTGAGIPKHVTGVACTVSQASSGATSKVTVTFTRDPGDSSLSKVNVHLVGYQSNNSAVQIASGSDSPITFVINNTGERVRVIAQAQGNSGAAPLETAPSTGIQLPLSDGGGYGTQTTTGVSIEQPVTAGQLAKIAGSSSIAGANLSGDVTTASSTSTTVERIRGVTVSATAPLAEQVLKYSGGISEWKADWSTPRVFEVIAPGAASGWTLAGNGNGFNIGSINAFDTSGSTIGGAGVTVAPTSNRPRAFKYQTASTASSTAGWDITSAASGNGISITLGTLRAIKFILRLGQTANMRIWIGLSDSQPTSSSGASAFRSDTPNQKFVGFRLSTSASDTKYKLITQTDNTHQTANNESGSHFDTSIHIFEIRFDGTNAVFLIDDVQVGSQSGNMPSADAELGPVVLLDNIASAGNQPYYEIFGMRGMAAY